MGKICAGKVIKESESRSKDKVDLPFDSGLMDIVCERREDGVHFNIHQVFRHHSPSGMEWGYSGSGPADFALNIMELFMREYPDMPCVEIWDKQLVTITGWDSHQSFKNEFIAPIPEEGTTIEGAVIRRWIKEQKRKDKKIAVPA
jgi:hypothetical protein